MDIITDIYTSESESKEIKQKACEGESNHALAYCMFQLSDQLQTYSMHTHTHTQKHGYIVLSQLSRVIMHNLLVITCSNIVTTSS